MVDQKNTRTTPSYCRIDISPSLLAFKDVDYRKDNWARSTKLFFKLFSIHFKSQKLVVQREAIIEL
jgi:hypothetical protein